MCGLPVTAASAVQAATTMQPTTAATNAELDSLTAEAIVLASTVVGLTRAAGKQSSHQRAARIAFVMRLGSRHTTVTQEIPQRRGPLVE